MIQINIFGSGSPVFYPSLLSTLYVKRKKKVSWKIRYRRSLSWIKKVPLDRLPLYLSNQYPHISDEAKRRLEKGI